MSESYKKIYIVFPGSLEFLTKRGGGREYRLSKIALQLSKEFYVSIVSPFYGKYYRSIKFKKLVVENIYFPALKNYPPKSQFVKIMHLLSVMVFYMTGVLFKIPKIKKDLFELILISDPIIGAIPGFIAKILKIKILCYEGNVTPWYMPMSYRFNFCKKLLEIFKLLCSKITIEISNAVIVNDGLIKKAMVKQGIKKNKIFVIRSLVDTQKFKPLSLNKNHNNNNFIVGFIGRLEEEKGASLLLELCKKTLTILPEVNFIILGEGSLEKYFRPLQNVKYVGWVDHNAIPQKLDMVNVIISFQKSFGVGELEALSCGKPIIVCKSNEMSEIIKKSEIGLICEPNIESYMESIKILIKNEQLLKRLSKASRDYILKNYSLEYIVNKWNFIIKSIL